MSEEIEVMRKEFHKIAEKGIKWFYAEENNKDIDHKITNEDWESYGEYTGRAISIFEKKNPEYKVLLFSGYTQKPINYNNSNEDGEYAYWDVVKNKPSKIKEDNSFKSLIHDF